MEIHEKLREHWADEKDAFIKYSQRAKEKNIKLLPYVRENGQLRAVFYGDQGKVTTFFDDGQTCDYSIARLEIVLFNGKSQKYLRAGKIYDAESNNLVDDVSIESSDEPSPTRLTKKKSFTCFEALLGNEVN